MRELNQYLVGAYIIGDLGKRVSITEIVSAFSKEEAAAEVKLMIELNGWKYGGNDYVDWAD